MGDGQFTAISGPHKGKKIPYLAESPVLPLVEWQAKHADTQVLLGDRPNLLRRFPDSGDLTQNDDVGDGRPTAKPSTATN